MTPVPLFGFLQGDTLGLLILAQPEDTMQALVGKLFQAARTRARPQPGLAYEVLYQGSRVPIGATVSSAGLAPLDRFDVVPRSPERAAEDR